MKRLLTLTLLFLLVGLPAASAQDESRLREEVAFLSDSLFAGRGFGTPAAQGVSFYLLRQFKDMGLRTSVQSFREGKGAGHNVIGVTPGWFRSYIVVGAYYDGLGTIGGKFFPGADANASGVAALLSLAGSLKDLCTREVGLICVAYDGHCASLSGSRAFKVWVDERYKVEMVVNLDILGSTAAPLHKGREDYLIALGGSSQRFALENANREPGLDLAYDYYSSRNFTDLFYKKISDQRWFVEAGVPSLMFTSGITGLTNKEGDLPSSLDYGVFAKRVDLISRWMKTRLK